MTLDAFRATLTTDTPPAVAPPLLALWHDARGDWDMAHQIAQDLDDASGAWIHAYLHRKEGDQSNAAYWYRRAKRPVASETLDDEWETIAGAFLRDA